MRCLQTTAAIAKELEVEQFSVNYQACDFLGSQRFPDGPPFSNLMSTSLTTQKTADEFSERHLQGIKLVNDFKDKEQMAKCWPEKWPGCNRRCSRFFHGLRNQYLDSKERVAHIVVAHNTQVNSLLYIADQIASRSDDYDESKMRTAKHIDYTAIAGMSLHGEKVKLQMGGFNSHLNGSY